MTPIPGGTPIVATPERRIWMRTASGRTFPITVTCGFRTSRKIGPRIATGTGCMSRTTVGRGLGTSLGDGRRITTDAGSGTAILGHGGLARCGQDMTRSGLRLMFRSGDGAADLASALDLEVGAALAGSRSGPVTGFIRGGVAMPVASAG